MPIEISCAIVFAVAIIVSLLIVVFANKESKKELHDVRDELNKSWASALAGVEKLHGKEVEALDRYIVSLQDQIVTKDEVIAEKDERIKQLEAEAALKNFVMSCARVDGSINMIKLKAGLEKRGIHVPDLDTFWQDVNSYEE